MNKVFGIAMLMSVGFVITTDANAKWYPRTAGGDCDAGDTEVGPPGYSWGCCTASGPCPILPHNNLLISELLKSLARAPKVDILLEEQKVDYDMAVLFEHLYNPKFRADLTNSCQAHDVREVTMLLQSTALMTTVDVEMEQALDGPNRGRFCWHSNGVRKCLWYTDC